MASIQVLCIHCDSALVYKHGKAPIGLQRFRREAVKRSEKEGVSTALVMAVK